LVENFRSREGVLDFINLLFETVMRRELGGVAYDERTRLCFGAPEERRPLSRAANASPRVELHIRLKRNASSKNEDDENSDAMAEVRDLAEAQKEARLIAMRLRQLNDEKHPIWDKDKSQFRPIEWRDMAILLRAPGSKAESYAKEFARQNVPLQVTRTGFYASPEISDLLNLLQLLDNPLQDLPVLAVLHSPIVGLTLDELATIRLALMKASFWKALVHWDEVQGPKSKVQGFEVQGPGSGAGTQETHRKVSTFLGRFARWRRLARQVSLSRCLEAVLTETHYGEWLLTQPRGEQRHANVQRFVGLAQQFDQFQRQGLFRFLHFIEAQQQAQTEPEVAAVSDENAVRLMSIHQSKGLEFPLVVAADLGKSFNRKDLTADIILDEEYGLCPQIKPPQVGKSYPSLPHWLAQQRQQAELLGEELRLLYVAMTRARDTLLLTATVTPKAFAENWSRNGEPDLATLLKARCHADWLGVWFGKSISRTEETLSGETPALRWTVHQDAELAGREKEEASTAEPEAPPLAAEPEVWERLQERLSWRYPFGEATRQAAKTSVTALRRRAAAEEDETTTPFEPKSREPADFRKRDAKEAESVGNAHHRFLQNVALERTGTVAELREEAERLVREKALSEQEAAMLDLKALASFWTSDLGERIRSQSAHVRRELLFTSRFDPAELARLTGSPPEPELDGEFVIVQGVADLAVILPAEIWLLDFKTDRLRPDDLPARVKAYAPQVRLYAQALARIYRRPVTESWLYFLSLAEAVQVEPG
jgi:ATP-dependent helicase/nuclease subunit A